VVAELLVGLTTPAANVANCSDPSYMYSCLRAFHIESRWILNICPWKHRVVPNISLCNQNISSQTSVGTTTSLQEPHNQSYARQLHHGSTEGLEYMVQHPSLTANLWRWRGPARYN